jgi:putative transcriptional regulator
VKSNRKGRTRSLGRRIIEGLTELNEALESGRPLSERFTVRTVKVAEPVEFDARRVRAVRERLGVSQAVFAALLGVSKILAQSWEQGTREPSALARRLLTEMERDPGHWRKLIIRIPESASGKRRKSA